MVNHIDYGQNVAAITAVFCRDPASYQTIQDAIDNQKNGNVGLWEILAQAGLIFTQEEVAHTTTEEFYWHNAIEDFADKVCRHLLEGKVPNGQTIRHLAWEAIGDNMGAKKSKIAIAFPQAVPT